MSFLKKTAIFLVLILSCSLLLVGCNSEPTAIVQGGDVAFVEGVQLDYDNMFFDDFTDGISYDNWYIGNQAWGAAENGGVIPQNVNYTDQGVLVFNGNGDYYTDGEVRGVGARKDGSLTGGALISKFVTGPGRYEIKMKVLPRLGACSAFWVYAFDETNDGNHEIDIELPGGKENSQQISFTNLLNTNYVTVNLNESQDVNVSQVTGSEEVIALNDGEWHTFGFDWYTNPKMVVYYVDGKVTAVSTVEEFVPYLQTRLWLGVWFPNNEGFVGSAKFESDLMQVDYVKYVPFLDQPVQPFQPSISDSQVATRDQYPTTPISVSQVNKVSNGNFEYVSNHQAEGYGWVYGKRNLNGKERTAIKEELTKTLTEQNPTLSSEDLKILINQTFDQVTKQIINTDQPLCVITRGVGMDATCGVQVDGIGVLKQTIDAVYQGFRLNLQLQAMGKGTVTVKFQKHGGNDISTEEISIDCNNWQQFSKQLVAPAGTVQIEIRITSVYGGQIFADNFVLHQN